MLAAAIKTGSKEGFDIAIEIINGMAEPVLFMTPGLKKSPTSSVGTTRTALLRRRTREVVEVWNTTTVSLRWYG